MFKVMFQDYREAFERSIVPKFDQESYLCGQVCDFLNRLLRGLCHLKVCRITVIGDAL